MWIAAIYAYTFLPEIIPIHFDGSGIANGYGNKATMFLLPVIGTAIFILVTVLSKYPQIFNYTVRITDQNKQYQYKNTTRMLRCLKLSIAIIFIVIVIDMYLSGTKKMDGLGSWFLIMVFSIINIPVAYFISRMFAKPKAATQNLPADGSQKN